MSDGMDAPNLSSLSDAHRRYVESLRADRDAYKRVAEARTVNVAINGKSPRHWSVDRWISLAGLAMVGSLGAWTLNVYAEYRSTLQTVKVLAESAPAVTRGLADIATNIAVLHVTVEGIEQRLAHVEGRAPRPRPMFSRESQFSPAAAERMEP